MRDIVAPRGTAVRLPAALAGVALGLLTVADPAAADQSPKPAAPVQGVPAAGRPPASVTERSPASALGRRRSPASAVERLTAPALSLVKGRQSLAPLALARAVGPAPKPVPAVPVSAHPAPASVPAPPAAHSSAQRSAGSAAPAAAPGARVKVPPRAASAGSARVNLTSAGTTAATGTTQAANFLALPARPQRSLPAAASLPDVTLASLLGLQLSPQPAVQVCADVAVGGIALSVQILLNAGGCHPAVAPVQPPVAPPPVVPPAPVAAPPAPVVPPAPPAPVPPAPAAPVPAVPAPAAPAAAAPQPAVPAVPVSRSAPVAPGNPPASPPHAGPPARGHYHPQVIPAAAHVLPPHKRLLSNIMVMVVIALIVSAFAGGLFAGLR